MALVRVFFLVSHTVVHNGGIYLWEVNIISPIVSNLLLDSDDRVRQYLSV